ncbi:MAG: HAMP domain-containing protein [Desulfobacterales bacterium]|nr:HAMP domain-containing protein [Desulfobacterales bacterium]
MKKRPKYSLQRTMIIYFLLVGFASLLVGVEFVAETHGHQLRGYWLDQIERQTSADLDRDAVFKPLDHLRNKAVLMIGIIMSVMVIVLTMFVKNITEPLQHMIEKARKISRGDLSQTIHIEADNELADLGGVINEMASNLQEIIHLSRNTCLSGGEAVTRAKVLLERDTLAPADIASVRSHLGHLEDELTALRELVSCFKFYAIERTGSHG